ncbi:MAG: hypothetical protein GXP25_08295 [Planctomycetes bacterium]|nr:hypothetical protein [Planctomycetota bacterium]
MINTPDWEKAKERMEALLEGEILDRPCIQITCPKEPGVKVEAPRGLHDPRETDLDDLLDRFEAHINSRLHLGEAFPAVSLSFGPDTFSAYLGCDLEYMESRFTSWAIPNITDWDNPPSFEFDPENEWWKRMVQTLEHAAARAEGRYLIGCPDTHAGGDCLAAMRGQERLCLDTIDVPEKIEAAMAKIEQAVIPYFDGVFDILRKHQAGTPCMGCWMPGNSCVVQCDFIALISTDMLKRFFLNEARIETEYLDHCFFHLDGPDALKHMDTILELPELDGLNYVVGSGQEFGLERMIDLYKRVQAAGKIAVFGASAANLETILEELDPRKLFLRMGAGTEEQAKEILKTAERITAEKWA